MVAAARMWWPIPAQWLGMCTLVILLFLLTLAPTIALWSARIRPPYFGSVTGRDLFRRSAGLPVDAVSPVDEAVEEEMSPDTTPRGAHDDMGNLLGHSSLALAELCASPVDPSARRPCRRSPPRGPPRRPQMGPTLSMGQ